ncbi:UbiA family prenyltransferase [Acrocarpospora catenulata]|uniref:UbiA family prenyltransferase n=1 Tax=Acrocarpospora catenulata TaxID=2836182 RepID=UPI001BDA18CA|nr:UbiA family prenyltransferase [Acrocarpospora catenulata]
MATIRLLSQPLRGGFGRTLGMCVTEARPSVLVIFLMRFATGAALETRVAGWDVTRVCATAVVWELAVFAVYLFNGAMDLREDQVNGSRRPIARGDLAPAAALTVSLAAAVAALLGSLVLGGLTPHLVAALLVLGFAYSGPPFYLKRRSSTTAVVGMSGGLLSYCAGFTAPNVPVQDIAVLPMLAVAGSLWMAVVGTLAKDLPDIAGDAAAGRSSAIAALGERRARWVLSGAALGLALTFCAVSVTFDTPLLRSAGTMLAGATGIAILCLSAAARGNRVRQRRPYRLFMVTQYAVHIAALLPETAENILPIS